MPKPIALRKGPSQDYCYDPLDPAFDITRLFETLDWKGFPKENGANTRGAIIRGALSADAESIDVCPQLE